MIIFLLLFRTFVQMFNVTKYKILMYKYKPSALSRSAAHRAAPLLRGRAAVQPTGIAQPANRAAGEPTETLQNRLKIEVKRKMQLWSAVGQ